MEGWRAGGADSGGCRDRGTDGRSESEFWGICHSGPHGLRGTFSVLPLPLGFSTETGHTGKMTRTKLLFTERPGLKSAAFT